MKKVQAMTSRLLQFRSAFLAALLLAGSAIADEAARPLLFRRGPAATNAAPSLIFPLVHTGAVPPEAEARLLSRSLPWHHGESLEGSIILSSNLPPARLLLFLTDREGHWFQALLPDRLLPGTNAWRAAFSSSAANLWRPGGHHLVWNHRARITPMFVGARVFFEDAPAAFTGECAFASAAIVPSPAPTDPPAIANLRQNAETVPVHRLFELRFQLPDRYDDPFNPSNIDVTARIDRPDGSTTTIPGFYTQDHYLFRSAAGNEVLPRGRPGWRVRYAPTLAGEHLCRVVARDPCGVTTSAPVHFTAVPSDAPGYVRVSPRDHRRFERDGAFFLPIGHNIRSPYDYRMDTQFPWRLRQPEDHTVYERYFRDMRAAGENFTEVWMCQWSMGLEWTESRRFPGYHGLGDYHLANAWQLDRVLDCARENDIAVNLVLNNHGRAGLYFDGEFHDSPYNARNGGFLAPTNPISFFSDPRAMEYQRRINRYVIARWGWDPAIFAWELWSELDLAGTGHMAKRPQFTSEVIEWHREFGRFFHTNDVNDHLVSTHISADYHSSSPELCSLPEITHCCVDAYHWSRDPLRVAHLVAESAAYYRQFDKPALITEFGGGSMGAGISRLLREHHAALWASACTPLAGVPNFWWWGLVDELNLYRTYKAVANFTRGSDYRDPQLLPVQLSFSASGANATNFFALRLEATAMANGTNLYAWACSAERMGRSPLVRDSSELPPIEAELVWRPVTSGVYRVLFYRTDTGETIRQKDFRSMEVPGMGSFLRIPLPPFDEDIAVKAFRDR